MPSVGSPSSPNLIHSPATCSGLLFNISFNFFLRLDANKYIHHMPQAQPPQQPPDLSSIPVNGEMPGRVQTNDGDGFKYVFIRQEAQLYDLLRGSAPVKSPLQWNLKITSRTQCNSPFRSVPHKRSAVRTAAITRLSATMAAAAAAAAVLALSAAQAAKQCAQCIHSFHQLSLEHTHDGPMVDGRSGRETRRRTGRWKADTKRIAKLLPTRAPHPRL